MREDHGGAGVMTNLKDVIDCLSRGLPDVSVTSLEPLGQGDFCVAFLLNGVWVVRKAKHDAAARALAREACLLERIGPHLTVAVPRPRVLSTEGCDDVLLSIHALVEGEALTRDRWLGLSSPSRSGLAGQVGAFLRGLHSIDRGEAGGCGLERLDHEAFFGDLATRAEQMGDLPGTIREMVTSVLQRHSLRDLGWSGEAALLNGDVSPEHVLFDRNEPRVSGVIDWGDAALGDPARDLIFLYEDWGDDFFASALDGYEAGADPRFMARVYLHYFADQLSWTLEAAEEGRSDDVAVGAAGLGRASRDLEALGL